MFIAGAMSENAELKCYFSIFARLRSVKMQLLVTYLLDMKKKFENVII